MRKRMHVLVSVLCCTLLAAAQARASDVVTEWNQVALGLTLSTAAAQAPVQQTRTMAIVQVAVHDAINAITGEYETYRPTPDVPPSASPEAAAVGAAERALRTLFKNQGQATIDSALADWLSRLSISDDDPSLTFGRQVADAILEERSHDHADAAQFDYTVPGAGQIGVWTRLNGAPAQLPGWGSVTPFVLRTGSQFRPDAPYDLTSERYARDYNEVQIIGRSISGARTGEQQQIALFWRASPSAIWNGVLTQTLAGANLDLSSTARSFALLYLAGADASIAVWDAKYTYNFWRPQLAIAAGDIDGNPDTASESGWLPLLPTPPHPEYPSAHSTNSSAMAFVLEQLFGDGPTSPVTLTFTSITRQWTTFAQAVDEVIDARVYSGIHFRTSDEIGARVGRQVGRFVVTHALRPTHGR
jgi:hypothetical protein